MCSFWQTAEAVWKLWNWKNHVRATEFQICCSLEHECDALGGFLFLRAFFGGVLKTHQLFRKFGVGILNQKEYVLGLSPKLIYCRLRAAWIFFFLTQQFITRCTNVHGLGSYIFSSCKVIRWTLDLCLHAYGICFIYRGQRKDGGMGLSNMHVFAPRS